MKDLAGYERFTPADKSTTDATYASRLDKRLASLRGEDASARASEDHSGSNDGISVIVGGTRNGRNAMVIPTGGAQDGEAPTIVEQRRTKPSDSMATRHETVVKQGDRIISIQRNEKTHRGGSGMVPPVD